MNIPVDPVTYLMGALTASNDTPAATDTSINVEHDLRVKANALRVLTPETVK